MITTAFRLAGMATRSRYGLMLLARVLNAPGSPWLVLYIFRRADPLLMREAIRRAVILCPAEVRRRLVERFRRLAQRHDNINVTELYWLVAAYAATSTARSYELFDAPAPKLEVEMRSNTNLLFARATAAYELSRPKDATRDFTTIRMLAPGELARGYNYLKAAHAAGLIGQTGLAKEFFGSQFDFFGSTLSTEEANDLDRRIFNDVLAVCFDELQKQKYQGKDKKIGVFFLSSTEALGHAILDPYYFLALNTSRFDAVIFVGPPRESYRPASRTCLEIVEQYGHYVETKSDILLNLSWMSMGTWSQETQELTCELNSEPGLTGRWLLTNTRQLGAIDLSINNYWSLLREAVRRDRNPADTFRHNEWHMQLPKRFTLSGEAFCQRHGIDLTRPIVVLHVRAENYHGIEKQSFRNADIDPYVLAVRHLLDNGYQVVRIGDQGMARLELQSRDYFELPFMDGYKPSLDPFLISRAIFMIGCQSGPCAYARALGVPLLSVNAVLHYTLLPGKMEMACFKQYIRTDGPAPEIMSLEAALAAGVYHFEGSMQFKRAGIRLEQASSDEILASVKDMIAWLDQPDLSETPLQLRFRAAVEQTTQDLLQRGEDLDMPIGDYLGIALPGYRISPSVAVMREREVARTGGGNNAAHIA